MGARFEILIRVAFVLMTPVASYGAASVSCTNLFERFENPNHTAFIQNSPALPHNGFGEIAPRSNQWTADRRADSIHISPKENHIDLIANGEGPAGFLMKLSSPVTTEGIFNKADQDLGRGLRFLLQGSEPDMKVEIELQGRSKIAREPYTATAVIKISELAELMTIPWEDFVLNSDVRAPETMVQKFPGLFESRALYRDGRQQYSEKVFTLPSGSRFYPSVLEISAIRFKLISKNSASRRPKTTLRLTGSMYRDFDLNWLGANEKNVIDANVLNSSSLARSGFIRFLTNQLQSRAAQNYALSVIACGHQAINDELAKSDFELLELPEKLTEGQFFSIFHPQRSHQPSPIEAGQFALYHGRYTHSAQLLTLLYGISPENLGHLHTLHNLFNNNGFGKYPGESTWHNMWNIFFDAPGADGPNAPRWWVRKFQEMKIATEPSSHVGR